MIVVKEFTNQQFSIRLEQHNEYFLLKYTESNKETMLPVLRNLSLALDLFDKLMGKFTIMN